MNTKRYLMAILVIASLVLAACGAATSSPTVVPTQTPVIVIQTVVVEVEAEDSSSEVSEAPAAPAKSCHGLTGPGMEGYLEDVTSLEHDGRIHVEFWTTGPEREGILEAGSYAKADGVKGYFWFYSPDCTLAQVTAEVNDHIERRVAAKANNAGWASDQLRDKLFPKQ